MNENKQLHLDRRTLAAIYGGVLDDEKARLLAEHLEEPCDRCLEALRRPSLPDELSDRQIDATLEQILAALPQTSLPAVVSRPAALPKPCSSDRPALWSFLRSGLRLVPLAAALALLLLWPGFPGQRAKNNPTVPPTSWNGSKGCQKAYLFIEVHRPRPGSRTKMKLPFQDGRRYRLGDIFVLRFLVAESGYIYLYREDADGNLERLFPFEKGDHRLYRAGRSYIFEHRGKRMAYFLDRSLSGRQTLWLLHSSFPLAMPHNAKQLSPRQRQLLRCADRLSFFVKHSRKKARHPLD